MKSKTSKAKGAANRTKRSAGSQQRMVGRPVEFHVKSSEWKKMPPKTKAALAEMVKCAAEFGGASSC